MQANTSVPTASSAGHLLSLPHARKETFVSPGEAEMSAWAHLETDKAARRKRAITPSLFVTRDAARAEVKGAVQSGDDARVRSAGASLGAYFRAQRPGSEGPVETARILCAQDVYFEVGYAGKVLAEFLVCGPKGPLGAVILPYAGGTLRPELLTATAFVSSFEAPDVDVVMVACEPRLSAVERAAVEAAAADRSDILLAPHEHRILPGALLTVLLATLAGTACVQVETEMAAIRLADDEVARLGATGSVDRLLELRKQVLARHR